MTQCAKLINFDNCTVEDINLLRGLDLFNDDILFETIVKKSVVR
jgi:hypothetical protein